MRTVGCITTKNLVCWLKDRVLIIPGTALLWAQRREDELRL